MPRCLVGTTTFVIMLACTNALSAQPDTGTAKPAAPTKRYAVCLYPKPESLCRSYLITEATAEVPLRSSDGRLATRLGWTLGSMINSGPRDAVGVVASFASDPYRTGPFRVEGRYRRWLAENQGLDLTLGYSRHNVGEGLGPDVWLRGVSVAAAFEHEVFGIESRVDRVRGDGRTETSTSVGVRFGSYAAPVATLALYLALIARFMIENP